jgi:hypothetical protein
MADGAHATTNATPGATSTDSYVVTDPPASQRATVVVVWLVPPVPSSDELIHPLRRGSRGDFAACLLARYHWLRCVRVRSSESAPTTPQRCGWPPAHVQYRRSFPVRVRRFTPLLLLPRTGRRLAANTTKRAVHCSLLIAEPTSNFAIPHFHLLPSGKTNHRKG